MSEEDLIAANTKLHVHGDDSIVECHAHGTKCRWGDLDPLSQLAILAGLDGADVCFLIHGANNEGAE